MVSPAFQAFEKEVTVVRQVRAAARVLCTVTSIVKNANNGNNANNNYSLRPLANTTYPIPTYTIAPDPTGCTLNVEIVCDGTCPTILPITNFIFNLHPVAATGYYVNACDKSLNN
jgi:hypothetical protein